jgi:hypothetical protein
MWVQAHYLMKSALGHSFAIARAVVCRSLIQNSANAMPTLVGACCVPSLIFAVAEYESCCRFNFPYLAYLESIGCNSWLFPYCRPQNALLAAQTASGLEVSAAGVRNLVRNVANSTPKHAHRGHHAAVGRLENPYLYRLLAVAPLIAKDHFRPHVALRHELQFARQRL